MSKITEQPWFTHPFKWYEESEEVYTVSLKLTDNTALDILAGLYDIYKSFERNDNEQAIADLNALAILLISHSMGYTKEAIEELLVIQANVNMDSFLDDVLNEGKDNG